MDQSRQEAVIFVSMKFLLGRLKKIDRLIISSFIPPLILSFLIALFVLTMQFFWLYIDEIMGKGIGFFQIIELIGYLTVSFVPLALPMSVLLASVMVFGNLGERYELSSMKSAGISLLRIMAPLTVMCIGITLFSFLASNFIIPRANLKFLTRLYDIRRQKPALAIEEGVFNNDFYGYSIYIGKKHADKTSIDDVIIYDQSKNDLIKCTKAKSGKMYTTEHGKRFVLELKDGEQIEEPNPTYREGGRKNFPFMRTKFNTYVKSFDLDEFDINATDESRFSDNQKMLSNRQILVKIDSIKKIIRDGEKKVGLGISKMFDTTNYNLESNSLAHVADTVRRDSIPTDTIHSKEILDARPAKEDSMRVKEEIQIKKDTFLPKIKVKRNKQTPQPRNISAMIDSINKAKGVASTLQLTNQAPPKDTVIFDLKPGLKLTHFYELLDSSRKARVFKETGSAANIVQSEIINVIYTLGSFKKKEVQHWQQYYQKYTLAVACLIFLFIGAPMGAIVRKGGFGYPLLIAIIFFIIYIMASKTFERLTDSMVLNVAVGEWITTILISLVGVFLTYRASKDVSSNIFTNAQSFIIKQLSKMRKK
jgi:lipopolysaccharide export system permease protein